eukprot:symbB.v1.2.036296.t1/scaffold5092.1/size31036/1
MIWPNLHTLILGAEYNLPLRNVQLPKTLETLTFGNLFNQSLVDVTFPESLQTLTFGDDFDQSLTGVQLPENLRSLTFGGDFNQRLSGTKFPDALENLTFGILFNQSLAEATLPSKLQRLALGDAFNQRMAQVKLPNTLQYLALGDAFNQSLEDISSMVLPSSLHTLELGAMILRLGRPVLLLMAFGIFGSSWRQGFSSIAQRPKSRPAWEWWESLGSPKWVCSPMIDQSERAFRILCRRYGVHLAYTPMIHAEPFAADDTFRKTYFDAWTPADNEEDRPLIAQLGGDDPKVMLQAAKHLEPHVDAIDVNFGCPTEDARKGGHQSHSPRCRRYGAYLLRDTKRVTRIVGTLASSLRVPVTAKIRLLPDRRDSIDLALAIEEHGAAALCVHGRTVDQRPKYAEKHGIESLAPDWDALVV